MPDQRLPSVLSGAGPFVNEISRRARRVRQMEVGLLWRRVGRKSRGPQRCSPPPLATARPPSLQTTVLVCSSLKLLWVRDPPCNLQSLPAASPGFPFRQQRGHEQAKPLHYDTASQGRQVSQPVLSLSSLRPLASGAWTEGRTGRDAEAWPGALCLGKSPSFLNFGEGIVLRCR